MDSEDKSADEISFKTSASALVSLGKDFVALLRDLALFVLAVLLLVFPSAFNTVLTNAGFEEGSLVGFKWKSKLIQSDTALKDAQATITDLKAQLDKTSQALADTQAKLNDPSLKDQIAKLEVENKQADIASSKVAASVATTIASNAAFVEKAQNATSTNATWGIVFSGDSTPNSAKYEVEVVAPKLGIPNASVYFRQGSYRGVAVVESRSQAEQVLYKAKERRADAYIVNMSNWCPSTIEKSGYRECISP